MVKEEDPQNSRAYAVLSYNGNLRNIEFKAISNNESAVQLAAYSENLQVAAIDLSEMMNFKMA